MRKGTDNPNHTQKSLMFRILSVSQKGGTWWRWSRPQSGYGIRGRGVEAEMKRTKKRERITREWFDVEKYYINL